MADVSYKIHIFYNHLFPIRNLKKTNSYSQRASWLRSIKLVINKLIQDLFKLLLFWSQLTTQHPIKVKPKKSEKFLSNSLLSKRSTMKRRRREIKNKKNWSRLEKKLNNVMFKKLKQKHQPKKW